MTTATGSAWAPEVVSSSRKGRTPGNRGVARASRTLPSSRRAVSVQRPLEMFVWGSSQSGVHSSVRSALHGETRYRNSEYVAWLAISNHMSAKLPRGYGAQWWGRGNPLVI